MSYSTKDSKYVCDFVKNRKANLISLFDSKCCICGFNKFQEALEFYHVNPKDKELSLSANVMVSLQKQIKEAKKCILVCANCHRGIHANYYKVPENYQEFFNEDRAEFLLNTLEEIKKGKKHYCPICGKLISKDSKHCQICDAKLREEKYQNLGRPNREQLKSLIRNKPFIQIGKDYGVTDNAIRRWCKKFNLPSRSYDIKRISNEDWEKI